MIRSARPWPLLALLAVLGVAAQDPAPAPLAPVATEDAAALPLPGFQVQLTQPESRVEQYSALQVMFLMTVIVLAPSMLMMLTSFTRIIIVLGFLRQALGTQQVPPNQVLIGLALFMTLFIMAPTFQRIQKEAIEPYLAEQIDSQMAADRGLAPLRDFMLRNTRANDLALFIELSGESRPATANDVKTFVLIPAFCLSELKTAFEIGFLIYIPFLVIDVVVASTVMAMGMMMLPPVIISLPFKLLMFVMVDGWHLLLRGLAESFI